MNSKKMLLRFSTLLSICLFSLGCNLVSSPQTQNDSRSNPPTETGNTKGYTRSVSIPEKTITLDFEVSVRSNAEDPWRLLPLKNGTLRSGEQIRIRFKPSEKCHIYILGHDSNSWGGRFFPNQWLSPISNPVPKNQWVELSELSTPDFTGKIIADNSVGKETFCIFASPKAQSEIEKTLPPLGSKLFESQEAQQLTLATAKKPGTKGFSIRIEKKKQEEKPTHHRLQLKLGQRPAKFLFHLDHK